MDLIFNYKDDEEMFESVIMFVIFICILVKVKVVYFKNILNIYI